MCACKQESGWKRGVCVCVFLRLCKQEDGREMCACMCVCAYVCLNRREGGEGVCESLRMCVSVCVEGVTLISSIQSRIKV